MSMYKKLKEWCKANCDREAKTIPTDIFNIIETKNPEFFNVEKGKFKTGSAFSYNDKEEILFVYKCVRTECAAMYLDCKNIKNCNVSNGDTKGYKIEEESEEYPCEFYEDSSELDWDLKSFYEAVRIFNIDELNLHVPEELVGTKRDLQSAGTKWLRKFMNNANNTKNLKVIVDNYNSIDEYFDDDSEESFLNNEIIKIFVPMTDEVCITVMKDLVDNKRIYKTSSCLDSTFRPLEREGYINGAQLYFVYEKYMHDPTTKVITDDLFESYRTA